MAGSAPDQTSAVVGPMSTGDVEAGAFEADLALTIAAELEEQEGEAMTGDPVETGECMAASLIEVLGREQIEDLGIDQVGYLSPVVLAETTRDLDGAADYFTPLFTCVDLREIVAEDLGDVPAAQRDCVLDAVLDDRLARVIFILGVQEGASAERRAELDELAAPAVDRYLEIVTSCASVT